MQNYPWGHNFQSSGDPYDNGGCATCFIPEYPARELQCPGKKAFACPTRSNYYTHDDCSQVFETQEGAQAHWAIVHSRRG